MPRNIRLIRADSLKPMPWKNGGGITRELAVYPSGASMTDFAWRISLADVEHDGAFSIFPGVNRSIVLLDGKGMRLNWADGARHDLQRYQPFAFAGHEALDCQLFDGPTVDFNLMLRRGKVNGRLVSQHLAKGESRTEMLAETDDFLLVFCAAGRVELRGEACGTSILERFDAIEIGPGTAQSGQLVGIDPDSVLLLARLQLLEPKQ
ncbi:HutD/Ves family protein [Chitinimonas sp. PSY-7]|uniref:HutD family protein n=1 Tax=Chitinimonas sp. PSY-7 TaxID=3459088 RepID=UPI0040400453